MIIDTNNPVKTSIISLIVSMVIFTGILWLWHPQWVRIIDKDGNETTSKELVVSFATTFSLVVAITVLLLFAKTQFGAYTSECTSNSVGCYDNSVIYF